MIRAQRLASSARECVQGFVGRGEEERRYRTVCMGSPALIQSSGLVQALVFLISRDETTRAYCDHLARVTAGKDHRNLLKDAQSERDLKSYMALTQTVTEASVWLRRFAQVLLAKPDGESS